MIELIPCDPHKWRPCIDSSKTSLKVVLLANGNDLPSISVAYSADMKKTYENISRILHKICYDYNWKHCADLKVVAWPNQRLLCHKTIKQTNEQTIKVVALLTALQTGYPKYCCFLCEWNIRVRDKHYIVRK
ncbi:hypothetical protein AVEN_189-1 [Araneus ventricosus]|uniref:Uncharacterized protein n=1 Tax=Araneus ventricosus TaxID=182803 RepID=A0A4Y2D3Z0_ARAVE|nr:hypothetical protein AVEN_189-1 [Araneus ventricosus]